MSGVLFVITAPSGARLPGTPRLQAFTCGLSIATFRYVPEGVKPGEPAAEEYLNKLNEALLTRLQRGGLAYPSNAVVGGSFVLRACIVNYHSTRADVDRMLDAVRDTGARLTHQAGRPA